MKQLKENVSMYDWPPPLVLFSAFGLKMRKCQFSNLHKCLPPIIVQGTLGIQECSYITNEMNGCHIRSDQITQLQTTPSQKEALFIWFNHLNRFAVCGLSPQLTTACYLNLRKDNQSCTND